MERLGELTGTAEEEVLQTLREIIDHLSSVERDHVVLLRKSVHACNLMGWSAERAWFEAELNGYRPDQQLAWYRKVNVSRYWRPDAAYDVVQNVIQQHLHGGVETSYEALELRQSIGDLVDHAAKGFYIPSGKKETRSDRERRDVPGQEVLGVSSTVIGAVLRALENDLFRWASSAYSALVLGEQVRDIWLTYQQSLDAKLAELGLSNILDQISMGLRSSDPQAWRQAVYSCRDLLHDLAKYLWQDERPGYDKLDDDDGKPIVVTSDKHVNRLIAYLHYKGVTGSDGEYLRAEWKRLRKLQALASKAHDEVTIEEAKSVVIAVYVAIAEVVRRTDMQPVTRYD